MAQFYDGRTDSLTTSVLNSIDWEIRYNVITGHCPDTSAFRAVVPNGDLPEGEFEIESAPAAGSRKTKIFWYRDEGEIRLLVSSVTPGVEQISTPEQQELGKAIGQYATQFLDSGINTSCHRNYGEITLVEGNEYLIVRTGEKLNVCNKRTGGELVMKGKQVAKAIALTEQDQKIFKLMAWIAQGATAVH